MSIVSNIVELLLNEKRLYDFQIRRLLKIKQSQLVKAISYINFSKKKWGNIIIIKIIGTKKSIMREITMNDTKQNNILDNRRKRLIKGIRQLDVAKKEGAIAINTRRGLENRNRLLNNILEQNVDILVEIQKTFKN